MSKKIERGSVVAYRYTLRDDQGDVIEECGEEELAHYLHGAGNIPPGLEARMEGHAAGETFAAVVPPDEGYGPRHEVEMLAVPRNSFPMDVELEAGMPIMADTNEGDTMVLWIAGVEGEQVMLDPNHPLAGKTLHYDIEILDIRDSTDEERSHGHPHVDGHHQH